MTISFRQDPIDGRCLTLLSGAPFNGEPIYEEEDDGGWKRILYETNQDFPDNYTPPSFLSSLSVNSDVRIYEYLPSVIETAKAVTIPACMIPIFFILYFLLSNDLLEPGYLITLDILLLIAGYISREFVVRHLLSLQVSAHANQGSPSGRGVFSRGASEDSPPLQKFRGISIGSVGSGYAVASLSSVGAVRRTKTISGQNLKTSSANVIMKDLNRAGLVFGTLYILSPLLQTLTRAWSSDTIIAIAVTMLITHIIFHDYTFVSRTKSSLENWHQLRGDVDRIIRVWKRVDNSLALNAIVFSAIVLASRLNSSESVFGFIFFSMTAFSFFPFLFKLINLRSPTIFLLIVNPIAVISTTVLVLTYAGVLVAVVFVSVVGTITFFCPYLLIKCLSLKKVIRGPWDIAHVNRRSIPPTPMGASVTGGFSYSLASPVDSGYVRT